MKLTRTVSNLDRDFRRNLVGDRHILKSCKFAKDNIDRGSSFWICRSRGGSNNIWRHFNLTLHASRKRGNREICLRARNKNSNDEFIIPFTTINGQRLASGGMKPNPNHLMVEFLFHNLLLVYSLGPLSKRLFDGSAMRRWKIIHVRYTYPRCRWLTSLLTRVNETRNTTYH